MVKVESVTCGCDMCGGVYNYLGYVWKLGKFHKMVCTSCDRWLREAKYCDVIIEKDVEHV